MRDEPKSKDDIIDKIIPIQYSKPERDSEKEKRTRPLQPADQKIIDNFFNHLPALALVKDLEGKYVYVNAAFECLGPGDIEEFIGKTDDDLFPPETASIMKKNDRAVISSGQAMEFVETIPFAGGPRLYLVLRFPIQEKDTEVFIGATAIDITALDPAEATLELSAANKKLQNKIKARKQLESRLRKQTTELSERVKELNCLYRISELTSQPGLKLDKILKNMVKIMAKAWQYPSITYVRIIMDDQVYATSNFQATPWRQRMEIKTDNGQTGSIEVGYLEKKPEADEGPFLKEQRWLLEVIATRLKTTIERKWWEEELRRLNNLYMTEHSHRKYVSKRLIELLEEDRRRVARELHDHVGQILTTLKMDIEMLRASGAKSGHDIARDAARAGRKVDAIMKEVKNISLGLRPSILEDLGLIPSLRALFNEMTASTGVKFHFFWEGIPERFDPQRELAVFRIIQEAATNALKHSRATDVFVNLTRREEIVCLSVEDNGQGFDLKAAMTGSRIKNSLGLMLMNERAVQMSGLLSVDARPGKGTLVMAEIPLLMTGQEGPARINGETVNDPA